MSMTKMMLQTACNRGQLEVYALVCFEKDDERMRIAIGEEPGVGRYKGPG
jgi:hypothetical protein